MSAPADAIQIAGESSLDDFLFTEHLIPRRSRGAAFLVSAVSHCAFFFLLPQLASVHLFSEEPPLKIYVARVQSLQLRVTEPLYAPPPPPRPRQGSPGEGAKRQESTGTKVLEAPAPEPQGGSAPPEPAPEPPKPAVVARRFELPQTARPSAPNQPVILQPPDPSVGMPVQQLPKVVAWNDPVLPRPKPKTFVTPGQKQPVPQRPPELTAPPTLQAASRGGAPSTINLTATPAAPPRPKLVVPASHSAPMRNLDSLPDMNGGEIATGAGDPANLIILSGALGKPNELVAVPPGASVPRTLSAGAGGGTGRGGNGAARGAGVGTGAGTHPGAGSGLGNGAAAGAGAGSGGSGTGAGGNGSGSGHGAGSGNGGAPNGSGTAAGGISVSGAGGLGPANRMASIIPLSPPPPGAPMPAPAARRGDVRPGVFDVIVVQSTAAEAQFRSFGILKCKPVYTVYLQLSMPKAWVLQYCLAVTAEAATAVAGVVRLDDAQPVTPPFPVTTVLSEVELQPKSSYTLVHGYLTAAGKFRNMTLLGKTDPQLMRLLQLLDKWEFRPAKKGEAPAEVEVLLAIPPA